MKTYIDYDEWYPVFSMDTEKPSWPSVVEVELDEAHVDTIQKTFSDFEECQQFLSKAYKIAKSVKKLEDSKSGQPAIGF